LQSKLFLIFAATARSAAYPIVLFGPLSLLSVIDTLLRHCGVRSLTGVSSRVRIWQGAFTGPESIAGLQAAVCEMCPAAALSRVLIRIQLLRLNATGNSIFLAEQVPLP
jgi:hypothetical protein